MSYLDDGLLVGCSDGLKVGFFVGFGEGFTVGFAEGLKDGLKVGFNVGFLAVGLKVGFALSFYNMSCIRIFSTLFFLRIDFDVLLSNLCVTSTLAQRE